MLNELNDVECKTKRRNQKNNITTENKSNKKIEEIEWEEK